MLIMIQGGLPYIPSLYGFACDNVQSYKVRHGLNAKCLLKVLTCLLGCARKLNSSECECTDEPGFMASPAWRRSQLR